MLEYSLLKIHAAIMLIGDYLSLRGFMTGERPWRIE